MLVSNLPTPHALADIAPGSLAFVTPENLWGVRMAESNLYMLVSRRPKSWNGMLADFGQNFEQMMDQITALKGRFAAIGQGRVYNQFGFGRQGRPDQSRGRVIFSDMFARPDGQGRHRGESCFRVPGSVGRGGRSRAGQGAGRR